MSPCLLSDVLSSFNLIIGIVSWSFLGHFGNLFFIFLFNPPREARAKTVSTWWGRVCVCGVYVYQVWWWLFSGLIPNKHPGMFFSLCVCVCVYVLAGKGKVKAGKGRPLKGGGDPAEEPTVDVVSVASGRGLGGSAPATPTEAETATNQSATGSWSRNSLRGSKCNFSDFLPPCCFSHQKSNSFFSVRSDLFIIYSGWGTPFCWRTLHSI